MAANLILKILNGPDPGREFLIVPDTALRLCAGRSEECEICIDDPTISRRHFELVFDGDGDVLIVRDVGSSNGTFVGDERIDEARILPGDTFRAGDIELALYAPAPAAADDVLPYTGREVPPPPVPPVMAPLLSPARQDGPEAPTVLLPGEPIDPIAMLTGVAPVAVLQHSDPPAPESRLARLTAALDPAQRLYALVDGGANFELVVMGRLMGHAVYTLFDGAEIAEFASAGPALVALGDPGAYLAAWDGHIGSGAGVLLQSPESHEYVHAHLRRTFVVADQQDQEFALPYWRPEIFTEFVAALAAGELRAFFGPVTRWVAEQDDGYSLAALEGGELRLDRI